VNAVRPPLLDTHVWIWYAGDQTKLARAELDALDALDLENRPFGRSSQQREHKGCLY
jgi:hypothetical protein